MSYTTADVVAMQNRITAVEKELHQFEVQLFKYTELQPTPSFAIQLASVVSRLTEKLAELKQDITVVKNIMALDDTENKDADTNGTVSTEAME